MAGVHRKMPPHIELLEVGELTNFRWQRLQFVSVELKEAMRRVRFKEDPRTPEKWNAKLLWLQRNSNYCMKNEEKSSTFTVGCGTRCSTSIFRVDSFNKYLESSGLTETILSMTPHP